MGFVVQRGTGEARDCHVGRSSSKRLDFAKARETRRGSGTYRRAAQETDSESDTDSQKGASLEGASGNAGIPFFILGDEGVENDVDLDLHDFQSRSLGKPPAARMRGDKSHAAAKANERRLKDLDLSKVGRALRLASKKEQDVPRRFTLVRVNPDGRSARVATEEDMQVLVKLLGPEEQGGPATALPATPAKAAQPAAPAAPRAPPTPSPCKRTSSQYKPGGPCDHCGVTESPQWRRGPAHKPQLCNACGTRYRRTSHLGSSSPSPSVSGVATGPPTGRKRESACTSARTGHKGAKEPKLCHGGIRGREGRGIRNMMVQVSA